MECNPPGGAVSDNTKTTRMKSRVIEISDSVKKPSVVSMGSRYIVQSLNEQYLKSESVEKND